MRSLGIALIIFFVHHDLSSFVLSYGVCIGLNVFLCLPLHEICVIPSVHKVLLLSWVTSPNFYFVLTFYCFVNTFMAIPIWFNEEWNIGTVFFEIFLEAAFRPILQALATVHSSIRSFTMVCFTIELCSDQVLLYPCQNGCSNIR